MEPPKSPKSPRQNLPEFRTSATAFLKLETPMSTLTIMKKLTESLPRSRISRINQVNPKLFRINFATEQDVNSALKNFRDITIPGAILEPPKRSEKNHNKRSSIIVKTVDPDIKEEEFIAHLKEHSVQASAARRILSNKTGKPSSLIRLTLLEHDDAQKFLERGFLELGAFTFPVEAPRKRHLPLRCFNCQDYDHHQSTCQKPPRCHKCAQEHSPDSTCTTEILCANCSGPHASSSNECPVWISKLREKNELFRAKSVQERTYAHAARPTIHSNIPRLPNAQGSSSVSYDTLHLEIKKINERLDEHDEEIKENRDTIKQLPSMEYIDNRLDKAIAHSNTQLADMKNFFLSLISTKQTNSSDKTKKRPASSSPTGTRPKKSSSKAHSAKTTSPSLNLSTPSAKQHSSSTEMIQGSLREAK
ncbi:uncharacterized protein LOC135502827 [Lineus longissimus]|uniref:uncharacterized protein LOC135495249 n=1 Tax=Lineus longissimus TaxID=88925 RepID=UPI00315DA9BE